MPAPAIQNQNPAPLSATGIFRRNYGILLGAFLYLRSISAARGRSWFWAGFASLLGSVALGWLSKHGFSSLW